MYMITITIIGYARPGFLPAGEKNLVEREARRPEGRLATTLLFAFVIGGLYGGLFHRDRGGGRRRGGAFIIGIARRKLSGKDILNSLLETTRTTAAVFTILIGRCCSAIS